MTYRYSIDTLGQSVIADLRVRICALEAANADLANRIPQQIIDTVNQQIGPIAEQVFDTMLPLSYTAQVVTITADQASGAQAAISADSSRKALKIQPPRDCKIALAPGQADGISCIGGFAVEWTGGECPLGAIYLVGLVAGDSVIVWKA